MDEQENKVNMPEQESKENIPEQKKKAPPMRILAYVLFGLQILGVAGLAVQSGANILRAIAYAVGFCAAMIAGVILLEKSYTAATTPKAVNNKPIAVVKKELPPLKSVFFQVLCAIAIIFNIIPLFFYYNTDVLVSSCIFISGLVLFNILAILYKRKWLYIVTLCFCGISALFMAISLFLLI